MYFNRKVGAPKGGRVHWLLLNLQRYPDFLRAYVCKYDYLHHKYIFYRKERRTIVDFFIVCRTSKRCFRCSYGNLELSYVEYFSTYTSAQMALRLWILYKKIEIMKIGD